MEVKENTTLPFQNVLITRKLDSSLAHQAYRRKTPYLAIFSCRPPSSPFTKL